jgi:small-conductance mechanosensitive channel
MIEHQVQKWQILDSTLVLDNPWCRVKQDRVLLPNGTIIEDYFVNLRSEIVLVFPLTVNQDVIFVRQYRHGVEEILLELPAGSFEPQTETSTGEIQVAGSIAALFLGLEKLAQSPFNKLL